MNLNSLVSIVITYYKKRNYIAETLTSIKQQSYKNYEIVFVYDDTDRRDLLFIKKLLTKFKRKKFIINKTNQGVAKSRNKAINKCKGKYIAFIDADDVWQKNKLKKQTEFMNKSKSFFSFTSYKVIDENNKIISLRRVNKDVTYKNLQKSNFIGLSTVMINTKISSIIKFPNLKTQEDFALWLKFLREGHKLKHIKNILSSWRKSKQSLSSNFIQKIKDAFTLFYKFENKNLIFSIFSVLVLSYNKLLK